MTKPALGYYIHSKCNRILQKIVGRYYCRNCKYFVSKLEIEEITIIRNNNPKVLITPLAKSYKIRGEALKKENLESDYVGECIDLINEYKNLGLRNFVMIWKHLYERAKIEGIFCLHHEIEVFFKGKQVFCESCNNFLSKEEYRILCLWNFSSLEENELPSKEDASIVEKFYLKSSLVRNFSNKFLEISRNYQDQGYRIGAFWNHLSDAIRLLEYLRGVGLVRNVLDLIQPFRGKILRELKRYLKRVKFPPIRKRKSLEVYMVEKWGRSVYHCAVKFLRIRGERIY